MKINRLTSFCGVKVVSWITLRLLSIAGCICFLASTLDISFAERLQDLDKNSIGSFGVSGCGIAGNAGTLLSSSLSSSSTCLYATLSLHHPRCRLLSILINLCEIPENIKSALFICHVGERERKREVHTLDICSKRAS